MWCDRSCGGAPCGLLANHEGACAPEPPSVGSWVYLDHAHRWRPGFVAAASTPRRYLLSPDGVFLLRMCVAERKNPPVHLLNTNDWTAWWRLGLVKRYKSGRAYMTNRAHRLLEQHDNAKQEERDVGLLVLP